MLIKIEEAQMPEEWLVWMMHGALDFAVMPKPKRWKGRLNAPLPFAHQHE
jgi:hypothetical protein